MRKENDSKKRILASLVMGLNCINSFAPMAVAVNRQPENVPASPAKETVAEPEQYTAACYQALDVLDSAIFATAEAAFTEKVGTATGCTTNYVNGETVETSGTVSVQGVSAGGLVSNGWISAGGTQNVYTGGIVHVNSIFDGGRQEILEGGIGYVTTMSGGTQVINKDATSGIITTMNGGLQIIQQSVGGTVTTIVDGVQNIANSAIGTITTMSGGSQFISGVRGSGTIADMSGGTQIIEGSKGYGLITTMSGGTQTFGFTAVGTVTTMRGGTQNLNSHGGEGYIITMSNGVQNMANFGSGYIDTMSGGTQTITSDGSGNIETMSGGTQSIASQGKGTIDTMSGGTQTIISKGLGFVNIMSGGSQSIGSLCEGTITHMRGGTQTIDSYGSGIIADTMSVGTQTIDSYGCGSIALMSAGTQTIASRGSGYITTMRGGNQEITSVNTIGSITTISGGSQTISGNGKGNIETMKGGIQYIYNGRGEITTMSGGLQNINTYCSGSITTMSAGIQTISSGGTGIVTDLLSGATQTISAGAKGIVQNMSSGGGIQDIASGGTGIITNLLSGATQEIAEGVVGSVTNMANGAVQNISSGGIGTVENMSGGSQTIASGGTGTVTALNAGRQNVSNGGSSLNTTVNGGTLAVLDNTAVVKNAAIDAGNILFNGAGVNYNLTGNFAARGGTVDLTRNASGAPQVPATYETLTIDHLSGNGTNFIMNTDLNGETDGDKLVIQAADPNAGGKIQVYDKSLVDGTIVVGPKKLLMVTDNSGVTTWKGNSLNTGGLWAITPGMIKEGNNWYLYLSDKEVLPNEVAQTNIAFTNAAYGTWRNAVIDDTLRMHLGNLRYNDVEDGVWARAKAGKMDASGFTGSYQMYQVGMDKKLANTVYGVAVDHMIGSNDYLDGNGKNSMTNLSLYATNYHPSGVYSDVVVKAGKYRSDLNVNSTNDAADYNAWGYSASYEIGKTIAKANGFFIEPEAQFILGKLQGADYTSNEGISVDRDGSTSFLGRLGFVAGRKLSNAGDYYFKASVWREFAGSGDINLSAVNNFGNKERMMESIDHKDTWFELGFGGNVKLAKMTHLYGDVVKTFGADIQKKWQVNAGVRWEF